METDNWQLCPKCLGEKFIENVGTSTNVMRTCPICAGAGILLQATGLPPSPFQIVITNSPFENS
jgi:DnaJ-class molecular chaperone